MKILSLDFGTSTLKAGFYFKDKISFYTTKNNSYFTNPVPALKSIIEKIKIEHNIDEIEIIVVDSIFPSYKFLDENYHLFDENFFWYSNSLEKVISKILTSGFKLKYILSYKDYINFLLTSKISTDFITYYNLEREKTLKKFIPNFNQVLKPSYSLGVLKDDLKRYFALWGNCHILSGSIDAFVSALGMGAKDIDEAGEIGGSTTCVYKIIKKTCSESPYFFNNLSIRILPMSCGGITIKWLKNIFNLDEEAIFEKIDENIQDNENLIFFPYLLGARSPIWSGEITSALYGLNFETVLSDIFKAVIEGVALVVKQNLDILKIEKKWISISGQAALSNSWNQIKSNIYNLNLKKVNYLQSAVMGNIFLGIKFLSNFSDAEFREYIKNFIKFDAVFKPEEKKRSFYNRKYKNFIKMQYKLYNRKN